MGASSSGLLDEAKISSIKGLVESKFQSFSVFYRQQYSAAYFGHLHQEVEPKKEGRGLLLTRGPHCAPEEVLYKGCVKFSCWDEQGKKCRERYIVLRRDYKVEIHENTETFNRGCAAKLVLQTAGGRVFTTEGQSRAHLEQTCAGVLNDAKEDSSSVVSSLDAFAVYLHLPYTGYTCFLFQQEEERDHFLSALKTCIRHCNLDPWSDSSYESQAYVQALRLYRQDKGCYESWEMLLGNEEKVLASQVMEEVLPWLQRQLQSKVKGKKTERIRQWLATVQATYTLVLEQLTASLEALREECRQTASANQALIRSDLDQIMTSRCFLEEKVRARICEEAEKVCGESVAPYLSSILEALTENISAGIQGMQHTLHTQMDSAFTHTNGETGDTKKALSTLRSISLSQWYRQVENLTEQFEGLKQRFGMSSTQRLVHSVHLEMEKLLDSAVYTLELFLQSSARLQPSQIPVKMQRAKERVLKQLDYDSRVVQRRLYVEALLEITLPALTRGMDSKWKTELQQFEQYIFSDYSSFILVHNAYDDVLRNILSKEIETVLQDATSKKSNNLLLDTSDLAISQYSLLGQTPPRSTPGSPAIRARGSSSAPNEEPAPVVEEGGQTVAADTKSDPGAMQSSDQRMVFLSPVIVVTQQCDESAAEEPSCSEENQEQVQPETNAPSATADSSSSATPDSETGHDVGSSDAPTNPTDASASPPNATVTPPDATANPPDVTANPPDVTAGPPDATPSPPDATANPPDATSSPPDATANPSDATPSQPDATVTPPDATPSPPNATAIPPDATPSPPDATADPSNATPTPPDATPSPPDATADPSNATPSPPDAAANPSNATPSPQDATADLRETSANPPDASAKAPDASPDPPSAPADPTDAPPDPPSAPTNLHDAPADPTDATNQSDAPAEQPDASANLPDAPVNPSVDSTNPIPDSPDLSMSTLSSLQSADVPSECAQSDQSTTPENYATPDLSTSDLEAEDTASDQHPCPSPSPPPGTDSPMKISLGSLSEAIGCDSATPPAVQTMAKQPTDRAVYLTGEIKDNWEMERVRKEEKEGKEETEAGKGKEEDTEVERVEGQMEGVAQTAGEPVDEGNQSSESPAEGATSLTTEVRESEEKANEGKGSELEMEKRIEDKGGPEEKGDHADREETEEKKDEEDLQSPPPMESQPESVAEFPLGSVAIIRDLVTEITEVETVITPCPTSSQTP